MSAQDFATQIRSKIESKQADDKKQRDEWCAKILKIIFTATENDIRIDYASIDLALHKAINDSAKLQKYPWHEKNPDPSTMPIANLFSAIDSINRTSPLCTVDWIYDSLDMAGCKHNALCVSFKPVLQRFDKNNKYKMETLYWIKKLPYKSYEEYELHMIRHDDDFYKSHIHSSL